MGIGTGIVLLVVGGILSFGGRNRFEAIDMTAIGYICMAGGALALVLALVMNQQRTNTTHSAYVERHEDVPPRP